MINPGPLRSIKGAALAVAMLAGCWTIFVLKLASDHRAFCAGSVTIASEAALIRQGVWNHLLSEAAGDRALARPGVPQPGFDSEAPINLPRVEAFLANRPDCCRVLAYGPQSGLGYLAGRVFAPSLMVVHVRDPRPDVLRSTSYKVDACSSNVRNAR